MRSKLPKNKPEIRAIVRSIARGFLAPLGRHVDELSLGPSGETPPAGMIPLRALTFDCGRLLAAGPEPDVRRFARRTRLSLTWQLEPDRRSLEP